MKNYLPQSILLLCMLVSFGINAQDSTSFRATAPTTTYLETPVTPDLQIAEHTLECWAYIPNGNPMNRIDLIETYYQGEDGYVLRVENGIISAYVMGSYQRQVVGGSVPQGQWVHLASTFDAGTLEHSVYINGVLSNSTQHASFSSNLTWGNPTGLKFGARGDDSNIMETIVFDEVRIWNDVRSQSEIANNMNQCLTGSESGLVLYYDFETISNDSIMDKTSYEHHATVVGNDTYADLGVFECQPIGLDIDEEQESVTLKIYPNPTTGTVVIETPQVISNVALYDINGSLVKSYGAHSSSIDISHQPSGIYFLKIATGDEVIHRKLVRL